MIDTVIEVKPRDDKKPGRIKFASAGELSSYNDEALGTAAKSIGQRVEYTLEENQRPNPKGGFYTRKVTAVKPVAGAENPAPANAVSFDVAPIATHLKRVADGIERLVMLLATSQSASSNGAASAPAPVAVNEIAAKIEKLGAKVGADAAAALVGVVKEKYPKDEAKQNEAIDQLLKDFNA